MRSRQGLCCVAAVRRWPFSACLRALAGKSAAVGKTRPQQSSATRAAVARAVGIVGGIQPLRTGRTPGFADEAAKGAPATDPIQQLLHQQRTVLDTLASAVELPAELFRISLEGEHELSLATSLLRKRWTDHNRADLETCVDASLALLEAAGRVVATVNGPPYRNLPSVSPDYSWHVPSRDRQGVDSNHLTTP